MSDRNIASVGGACRPVDGDGFRRLVASIVFALALLLGGAAAAETRVALVIGNADYGAMGRLKNPVNDARLMAQTLRDVGFRVIELIDADQQEMKRSVRDFGRWLRRAGPEGVALFYYAGHGVQVAGRNYLLPVEAQILAEGDVDIESVAADSILEQMEHANTGVNIVILDACRNNPFQQGFRSASRGLARMEAPTGSYIAYSTAPGQLAMDGDGPNSPFTLSLANAMQRPGLSIERVFKTVRREVAGLSEERQIPWSSSSLIGEFSFRGGSATATAPQGSGATPSGVASAASGQTRPASPPVTVVAPPASKKGSLPHLSQVPPTRRTAMDGLWLLAANNIPYQIEAGRIFAMAEYMHLLIFPVEAYDVVVRDVTQTGPGQLAGQDLALLGPWTGRLQADGTMTISVQGALGPFNSILTPIRITDPQWFAEVVSSLSGG
ncbi:MAG: caspase family protein [Minwuia sp.]|uniref:caspase family protein n=1 Tax=Minwuia sp. TaxID=2493630 RepID=UPI003A85ACB1